jgi:hypothetical protein
MAIRLQAEHCVYRRTRSLLSTRSHNFTRQRYPDLVSRSTERDALHRGSSRWSTRIANNAKWRSRCRVSTPSILTLARGAAVTCKTNPALTEHIQLHQSSHSSLPPQYPLRLVAEDLLAHLVRLHLKTLYCTPECVRACADQKTRGCLPFYR